jgi:hypothetical protein
MEALAALPQHLRRQSGDDRWIALPLEATLEALDFFERHEDDRRPYWVEPYARSRSREYAVNIGWLIGTWGVFDSLIADEAIPAGRREPFAFVRRAVKGWARRFAAPTADEMLAVTTSSEKRRAMERSELWPAFWSQVEHEHRRCVTLRKQRLVPYFDMDLSLVEPPESEPRP